MKTKVLSSFDYKKTENKLTIYKGYMFAYGYVGYVPNTVLYFNKTAATQYHFVYVEIDKSVIPNTCAIKVKNNQGGNKILPTTFRQDVLSSIKTGVYQLPLYLVELDSNGIKEVVDLRSKIKHDKIKKVKSTNETNKITGVVEEGVVSTTYEYTDCSERLATTGFVYLATFAAINN